MNLAFLNKLEFTDKNKICVASYFNLADTIADLIGPHCEVAIHSLESIDKSLVKIVNGHHTGRSIGAPITDMGLKMLKLYAQTGKAVSKHYFGHSKYGALIKSSTCILTGEDDKAIGLFCVNINLSCSFPEIIKTFLPDVEQGNGVIGIENYSTDTVEVIEQALEQAIKEVEFDSSINLKNRNKTITFILYEASIFEFKDAVAIVSQRLGITRHTVYKFLREFKQAHE